MKEEVRIKTPKVDPLPKSEKRRDITGKTHRKMIRFQKCAHVSCAGERRKGNGEIGQKVR